MIPPNVISAVYSVFPFSQQELKIVSDLMTPINLTKNEVILEEGQHCNTIYLIENGCLRSYYNNDGVDITLSFSFEDQFTTSFMAYVNREPSNIIISAMENSKVWLLNNRAYPRQQDSTNAFSTFIRRVAIRILAQTEEHYTMMRINTPADRYDYILKNKPELLQRIPLSYLASYLGVSRETLSRIRGNKY
jgi:CRP-like cAMP-binding protein